MINYINIITKIKRIIVQTVENGQVTSTSSVTDTSTGSVTGKEASYKIEEEMRMASEPEK